MELQQSLNDTKKEAADNERTLQHWQNKHDKLKLEDIECVVSLAFLNTANFQHQVTMRMTRKRPKKLLRQSPNLSMERSQNNHPLMAKSNKSRIGRSSR